MRWPDSQETENAATRPRYMRARFPNPAPEIDRGPNLAIAAVILVEAQIRDSSGCCEIQRHHPDWPPDQTLDQNSAQRTDATPLAGTRQPEHPILCPKPAPADSWAFPAA